MKTPHKWLIFTLVAVAQFMVVLDSAITNVALPTIRQQLHFSTNALQWVVTAYTLTFGGFLLLGGRAADLFGRKRMLLIGMGAFTLFSLLSGLAQNPAQLIIFRALQGLSASFMSPAALSTVLVTFRDGPDRNKALSFWTLVATGGAAIGLLLGGVLTQYLTWRWNFFINLPVGILIAALIARYIPEHEREETDKKLDGSGALLVTSSLMLMVLAFSQAPIWGWLSFGTLGTLAVSFALLAGFIFNESRVKKPLMPLHIFKIRNVRGANMIMAPLYAMMLGSFFLLTLYIQGVLHFSPTLTGLAFLPFPITIAIMSSRMPKLVARYGFRRFLIAGPLIVSIGFAWLTLLHTNSNYWFGVLPAAILMPLGIGMSMMPVIAAATAGVPGHEAGLASGLITTAQQMGGSLGLSILSGVAASVTAGSVTSLGQVGAAVHGYHIAFIVAIIFAVFASLIAATVIRNPRKTADAGTPEERQRLQAAASMGH